MASEVAWNSSSGPVVPAAIYNACKFAKLCGSLAYLPSRFITARTLSLNEKAHQNKIGNFQKRILTSLRSDAASRIDETHPARIPLRC